MIVLFLWSFKKSGAVFLQQQQGNAGLLGPVPRDPASRRCHTATPACWARRGRWCTEGLQICCTRPAHMLHRACKYVAGDLQIYCTGLANMPQICCSRLASMLHAACKYAAHVLQICYTRLANMLHSAQQYAAQGLPVQCTELANMLHLAYKHYARPAVTRYNVAQ